MSWKTELKKIDPKNCPQRQDSTSDQLVDLIEVAHRFGFYDAADYLRSTLTNYAFEKHK
jgi:hypothetical protein